ncbi:hypothetical protein FS837_007082 [Tulasnella sp. UAMH 9824]|nr:hypothetical protein FS837_007082 [Tulasnella sp. UAMH 9824]
MASTTETMPATAPTTTPTPPPRSILSPPRPPSAGKVKKHGRFASVSALPTLRAMYQRAARAFLQRNTTETQYLIDAAFQIITPPQTAAADHLSSQRKKWDILRITLETTLYTSPPAATPQPPTKGVPGLSQDLVRSASPSLNNNLRSNLLLSPPSLLATLHTRSLQLFTPLSEKPSSAFLPAQILVSLVLASLKLDCAHVGRGMVEDWLARRPPPETEAPGPDVDEGYAKVVDVYCLHVLPRLGEWEYAKEFLSYEIELPVERRSHISETLARLHAQSQIPSSPPPPYRTKALYSSSSSSEDLSGSRPHSRASSATSSSASTYTAIPATPRPSDAALKSSNKAKAKANGLPTDLGSETRSPSRASTVKGTGRVTSSTTVSKTTSTNLYHAVQQNGSASSSTPQQSQASSSSQNKNAVSPLSNPSSLSDILRSQWHLLKRRLTPILHSHLPFLVCVLLPALGFILAIRSRARAAAKKQHKQSADQLRKKLLGTSGGGGQQAPSLIVQMLRAIKDAVVMAGRGIV